MPPDFSPQLIDIVEQCILAFERDGETGLEGELGKAGPLADPAREHIEILRKSGLLRPPELPEYIGTYRVIRRLGTGGMGTVFLAEQIEPIQRRVAIKVIRPGMDSHEILARFAIEQNALALLNHPGIARILDAGSTPDGRPYLVMEHVAGVPINRYCDERQLDIAGRLRLLVQVCDAVQHAHHKGIIHRDLKPSNILVSDRDGQVFPVIIDFGVAKSLGASLATSPYLTVPGRLLGTPEYMSPEQAANEADIDTRTDVYSLGTVMYELLTGSLPFAGRDLRGRDVARVLREEDPPTPSTRVGALGDRTADISKQRRATRANLQRGLRGDLDWIVLRALAKDRNRRYGMPGELAADIHRHLQHEPVTAGPPGSWYRFSKFCARHRLQATAAAIVLGALGTGLVTSTVFYREAAASSTASHQSLDAALQAVAELVQVGNSDLVSVPHLEAVRRDLLSRAVAFYRDFLQRQLGDDARLLPHTIHALVSLGHIHCELGEAEQALANFREAEAIFGRPVGSELNPTGNLDLCFESLTGMAMALSLQDKRSEALDAAERATTMARQLLANHPGDRVALERLARSLARQADFCDHGHSGRQLTLLDEALVHGKELLAIAPNDPKVIATVVAASGDRASLLLNIGKRDEALAALQPLLELHAKAKSAGSWSLAQAMVDVAGVAWRCDDHRRALEIVAAVLPDLQRFAANHPSVIPYRTQLIQLLTFRANAELDSLQFAEAVATQRQIQSECEAALQHAPDNARLKRHLAMSCRNIVACESNWRDYGHVWDVDQMAAIVARGLATLDSMPADTVRESRSPRFELLRMQGLVRRNQGNLEGAATSLHEAMQVAATLVDESSSTSVLLRTRLVAMQQSYSEALLELGRFAEAEPLIDAVVAESESTRDAASMQGQWRHHHRMLLRHQARVRGSTGNFDGMVSVLGAFHALDGQRDWIGRMNLLETLTAVTKQLRHNREVRVRVVERARMEVDDARRFIAENSAEGTGHGTVVVMAYRTEVAALALEAAGGDADAIAASVHRLLEAATALREGAPGERSDERAVSAIVQCGAALLESNRPVALDPFLDGVASLLGDAPDLLAEGATRLCKEIVGHGAPTQQRRNLAVELLRRAVAVGLPAARLTAEHFPSLAEHPEFRSLVKKGGA